VASNSSTSGSIYSHENQSPWLTMDAANTIFTVAKRRCYINIPISDGPSEAEERHRKAVEAEQDAGWEILDELEGVANAEAQNDKRLESEKRDGDRPWWLPRDMSPTLEEPPKWSLLAGILHEIEQGINDNPGSFCACVLSSPVWPTSSHPNPTL
jgi:DNA excision repair protein ERCC-4